MEAWGYVSGESGWIKVITGKPPVQTGDGGKIEYQPQIGGYYPGVSGNRGSSGYQARLVNWRV